MAVGFKLGITKLCPLLDRLQFSCTGLKMSVGGGDQAASWLDGLCESVTFSRECELVFKKKCTTIVLCTRIICLTTY